MKNEYLGKKPPTKHSMPREELPTTNYKPIHNMLYIENMKTLFPRADCDKSKQDKEKN